jgi:hypothetical protein
LVSALGAKATFTAAATLSQMAGEAAFASYDYRIRQASGSALEGARQKAFTPRELKPMSAALLGGAPVDLDDAAATIEAELRDLDRFYRKGAQSNWRKFWNLSADRASTPTTFKSENECRNYLLTDLEARLSRYAMRAEEMTANSDRIDIVAEWKDAKLPVEAKVEDNPELWVAAHSQLSQRYLEDYKSGGYGIFLVFWSGGGRGRGMTAPPAGVAKPTTAPELETTLKRLLSDPDRGRVRVLVMDLSAPHRPKAKPAGRNTRPSG